MTQSTRGRSTAGGRRLYPQLGDPEWLRTAYLDQHLSLIQVAARVGCSQMAARMALVRAEIPIRPAVRASALEDLTVDRAVDLIREHGLSGAAEALGVAYATLEARLNALRILGRARELHRERAERRRAEKAHWPAELRDREWLQHSYQRLSMDAIAVSLHVSAGTVAEALAWHGIPRRPGHQRPPLASRRRTPAPEGKLVCLVPDCPAAAASRGLCARDVERWRAGTLPGGVEPLPPGYQRRVRLGNVDRGNCLHDGCWRTPRRTGYCFGHRHEAPKLPRVVGPEFVSANADRTVQAAAETVQAARRALTAPTPPSRRRTLTARVEHPDATLAELAALLGMTKDAYAARLRRALADVREPVRKAS